MANSTDLTFSGLHLPRPLDAATVRDFLTRLAADRDAPRVVFEVRADQAGIRHLVGCHAPDVQPLRRLLGDLIPGSVMSGLTTSEPRPSTDVAAHLKIRPAALPLLSDVALATTRSVLSAMALRLRAGESLTLQVVLGPRHSPKVVRPGATDPLASWIHVLTGHARPAATETRGRLKERASQAGFAATIRIGASSPDPGRRRRFMMGLLAALSTAQSPQVRIDLVREHSKHLDGAHPPLWWPLHLAVSELVGLLGWPLGGTDLPGLPPAHPRPLRAAASVHTGSRVFAESAAPGDTRQLGIAAKDMTYHAVAYGPVGSGKTNVLLHLILADIEAGRAVAVLDPKKQLIDDILARIPEGRADDVIILDASEKHPTGFNPLDVTGRDPDVVVDGILAVLQAVFADGWGPRTSDILSAALRTLARTSSTDGPATLIDLPRLLTDLQFRRARVERVQGDIALAGFWAWYEGQSPAAQAAVIAAPLNKLRQLLLRPALIRMLDQRDTSFRLRDIWRENKVVLVPLNEGLIGTGTAALLGSLIISDLWQATQERADEAGAAKRPGMVFVDEAPRFLHLAVSLESVLAVSRSMSVCWFLAAQFRGQFPPALRSAVDMNARSKIVFATEFEDARDMARLSPDLVTEDFMALPKFHAYVNLVADGHPSGWALAKTLPPTTATTNPNAVRRNSQRRYGPTPSAAPHAQLAAQDASSGSGTSPTPQIGRKRRQQR
jgi:Type IV secretory system Conjugative DNA transfer